MIVILATICPRNVTRYVATVGQNAVGQNADTLRHNMCAITSHLAKVKIHHFYSLSSTDAPARIDGTPE